MDNFRKCLARNYHLTLTYGAINNYTIHDIYKAVDIVDKSGLSLSDEILSEYNLFLLESDSCYMVFKGKNSQIIIPLKYIETIFNSDNTITIDKLFMYAVGKEVLDCKNNILHYFKNSYIKLDTINGEYIFDGKINNSNYFVVPIRNGKPYILSEELIKKAHTKLKKYMK